MDNELLESLRTLQTIAFDINADPRVRMQIDNLYASLENKQFYLPVVGQFSAGKSHFINNLLGRDILPVKTTETTSFLTIIRFGKEDKLLVKTHDCQEFTFDISVAKQLSQQSISDGEFNDHFPELKTKDICTLEIEVNCPLLEGGLILVDTPGINTLHSAHEKMTCEFLPEAQAFLYISGSQPSRSDVNFLQRISEFGLDVIFIRTRLDEINEHEESIDAVVTEDCEILKRVIDTEQHYFAISNHVGQPHWQERFTSLQMWLNEYFSSNIQSALEKSVNQNIRNITTIFRAQLDKATRLAEFEYQGDPEQFATDLKQLEIELALQKKDIMLLKDSLSYEFALVKREVIKELERLKVKTGNDFHKTLLTAEWISSPVKVQEYSNQCIKELSDNIQNRVSAQLTLSVENIYRQRNESLSEIELISSRFSIDEFSLEINTPSLDEVVSRSDDALLMISRQLSNIEQQEAALKETTLKLTEDTCSVNNELKILSLEVDASREVTNRIKYVPQYITDPGDDSFSNAFSMLGQAVDLAIMFMPTPAAPVKAAANGKKVIDAAKTAKKISDVTQTVKKASTMIQKTKAVIDKYKPVVQQQAVEIRKLKEEAKEKINTLANSNDEKERNIGQFAVNSLQLLEVEFWMRKLGENFDEPSFSRIDHEHRRQFEALRAKAEQEMYSNVQRHLKKLSDMGLLNEKLAYEQKKHELLQLRKNELEAELDELKSSSLLKQKKRQRDESVVFYCQQMNNALDTYIDRIKNTSDELIEQFMVKLSLNILMDSESIIKQLTDQISELKNSTQRSAQEKKQKLTQINQFIEKLDRFHAQP